MSADKEDMESEIKLTIRSIPTRMNDPSPTVFTEEIERRPFPSPDELPFEDELYEFSNQFPRRQTNRHPLDSPIFFVSREGRVDAYITDELTGRSVLISSVPDALQGLDTETDDDMPELEQN